MRGMNSGSLERFAAIEFVTLPMFEPDLDRRLTVLVTSMTFPQAL